LFVLYICIKYRGNWHIIKYIHISRFWILEKNESKLQLTFFSFSGSPANYSFHFIIFSGFLGWFCVKTRIIFNYFVHCKGPVTLHNDNDTINCKHAIIGKKIVLVSTQQRKW
jgi:hypothetical protein